MPFTHAVHAGTREQNGTYPRQRPRPRQQQPSSAQHSSGAGKQASGQEASARNGTNARSSSSGSNGSAGGRPGFGGSDGRGGGPGGKPRTYEWPEPFGINLQGQIYLLLALWGLRQFYALLTAVTGWLLSCGQDLRVRRWAEAMNVLQDASAHPCTPAAWVAQAEAAAGSRTAGQLDAAAAQLSNVVQGSRGLRQRDRHQVAAALVSLLQAAEANVRD